MSASTNTLVPPPSSVAYDPALDELHINGKRYAMAMFGSDGLMAPAGTVLRVVDGPADVVTVERVDLQPEQQAATPVAYTPGEWYMAKDVDDMRRFFRSRLPAIREAAHEHGYAIGVHGSERRDFDLIAAPWRDGASAPETLAHAVAQAACGIDRAGAYNWTQKPAGRVAVTLPICWVKDDRPSAGCIDLSVMLQPAAAVPDGLALVPVEPTTAMSIAGGIALESSPAMDVLGPLHDAWSAMLAASPSAQEFQVGLVDCGECRMAKEP